MDGVVKQINTVMLRKDVNLNLVNVIILVIETSEKQLLLLKLRQPLVRFRVNVVKAMDLVSQDIAALNMDGVERVVATAVNPEDVIQNMEFVGNLKNKR